MDDPKARSAAENQDGGQYKTRALHAGTCQISATEREHCVDWTRRPLVSTTAGLRDVGECARGPAGPYLGAAIRILGGGCLCLSSDLKRALFAENVRSQAQGLSLKSD